MKGGQLSTWKRQFSERRERKTNHLPSIFYNHHTSSIWHYLKCMRARLITLLLLGCRSQPPDEQWPCALDTLWAARFTGKHSLARFANRLLASRRQRALCQVTYSLLSAAPQRPPVRPAKFTFDFSYSFVFKFAELWTLKKRKLFHLWTSSKSSIFIALLCSPPISSLSLSPSLALCALP